MSRARNLSTRACAATQQSQCKNALTKQVSFANAWTPRRSLQQANSKKTDSARDWNPIVTPVFGLGDICTWPASRSDNRCVLGPERRDGEVRMTADYPKAHPAVKRVPEIFTLYFACWSSLITIRAEVKCCVRPLADFPAGLRRTPKPCLLSGGCCQPMNHPGSCRSQVSLVALSSIVQDNIHNVADGSQ
jgi:hypothetical protein